MKKREHILFITPSISSFNRNDISALQESFDVDVQLYNWSNKIFIPFLLIKQLFACIYQIKKIDACIISFAGWWSFMPAFVFSFTKVKTVIILHGTESAAIPSLSYGNLRKNYLKRIIKSSLGRADLLLPVSQSILKTQNTFGLHSQEENQGILVHFSHLKTPYEIIHNGLKINDWKNDVEIVREENSFIAVISEGQFYLKGGDLIVQLAREMANSKFTIVGMEKPLQVQITKNLSFLGKLDQEELKKQYYTHTYYFQLSAWEGFGLSLCEAMLCGCIPLVSSSNILPKLVKNEQLVISKKNVESVLKVINYIKSTDLKEYSLERQTFISNELSLKNRSDKISKALNILIG